MRGGAERMLRVVADMFPDAPIFTLLYDENKLGEWFPRERVRTSSLQKNFLHSLLQATSYKLQAPFLNHHLYLRKFPQAVEAWDFSDFDLVLSFSSAFAHGVKTRGLTRHLCYVHTPARYLWDQTFDVLDRAEKGPFGKWKRAYLERTFHKLRQWDVQASGRPDRILAASKAVQRRIEFYWRRESEVLYPPVDTAAFPLFEGKRGDYYVIASTLAPYKRIELAIEACHRMGRRLLIVGEGPHRDALEKFSLSLRSASSTGQTVEFLGYRKHADLVAIIQKARGFLFPGEEDFGIAPLEAMSTGTPVIALGKGGALETVLEGKTGEFFQEATVESLLQILQIFEQKSYSIFSSHARAEEFALSIFQSRLKNAVEAMAKK